MKIDSHQHFWKYNPSKHTWMTSDMSTLKQDFLPGDLKPLLEQCQLDGCVAVQASQSEKENEFLIELAQQNDFIKGIVGWVDLQSEDIAERLSHFQQSKSIKGFRHVLHDEEDIDFMLRPNFLRGIDQLRNFDFTYDILVYPQHLGNTLKFVSQFPDQPFVIDHIAKPNIDAAKIEEWKKDLKSIGAFENVYCKISGMVTEAKWNNWRQDNFTPYLDAVLEVFGIERVMYGSDWPVCTLSATYKGMYHIVETYFSQFTVSEQNKFFWQTATQFYNL